MTRVSMHTTNPLVAWGRQLLAWLTGTGFLTLHAAAFFISLVVLIPWNLYRSPGDFWVADPLRTWAFLLAFHAVVVGAITLAWGIVKAPSTPAEPPATGPMATWKSRASLNGRSSTVTVSAQARPASSSGRAEEWARRWLDETAPRDPMAPGYSRGPVASWALGNGHQLDASGTVVPGSTGLTPGYIDLDPDGHDPSAQSWRTVEWPPPPPDEPRATEEAPAVAEEDVQIGQDVSTQLDPLRAAASMNWENEGDDIDAELEWQWIEAAASAWLSRRTEPGAVNGHNGYHGPPEPDDAANMP